MFYLKFIICLLNIFSFLLKASDWGWISIQHKYPCEFIIKINYLFFLSFALIEILMNLILCVWSLETIHTLWKYINNLMVKRFYKVIIERQYHLLICRTLFLFLSWFNYLYLNFICRFIIVNQVTKVPLLFDIYSDEFKYVIFRISIIHYFYNI